LDYLDLTLSDPTSNLALDEALLLEAEAGRGGEVLRVWETSAPVVVLGAGGVLDDDVNVDNCQKDGVPILRRSSGGGTVLLGRGCLLYCLVLRFDRDPALSDIRASYRFILGQIADALAVPSVIEEGTSDLALNGRKFAGSAQQRKRSHLLHHGTLLYDFDLPLIGRYLRLPRRQPEYRGGRSHDEFLVNLPRTRDDLKAVLRSRWCAERSLSAWPASLVSALCAEKYGRDDWTRRR
jgi:lipoate-protein ligase A